jgi:hypothetical protein
MTEEQRKKLEEIFADELKDKTPKAKIRPKQDPDELDIFTPRFEIFSSQSEGQTLPPIDGITKPSKKKKK